MALAGAVPARVGDSDTVAVAVKARAGVVVGTFTTVADTVGLGDKGEGVAVAPVLVGVAEAIRILVGDAVGVGVEDATRVAVGAGEEVRLGEGVNVAVEVATEVEVGEGV